MPKRKKRAQVRDLIPDINARRAWGEKLRAMREAHGISQKQVADLVDVMQNTISNVERGIQKTSKPYRQVQRVLDQIGA